MNEDRLARICRVREHLGWFEGPNGVEEALALPQTTEEVIALLSVMGVRTETNVYKRPGMKFAYKFTAPDGRVRYFNGIDYPWNDPWLRPATILHCAIYDEDPYPAFGEEGP